MSHHSRLSGFIIDCQSGDLEPSAAFWSAALGVPRADPDSGGTGQYAEFDNAPGGLHFEVQTVEHPSRVHLDIETDDIEAEVKRLEALGATRIAFVKARWWVMEAPTGHRFCVVPMKDEPRRDAPNRWP
ncbi:MAG: VOC family protein [Lysobacter sp.]|nr:VOC family protein [Lysobacter sp.]MDQ3510388.1 VOC family protein [Pseudomonadota bacterium]